jgi:hypothetical protein
MPVEITARRDTNLVSLALNVTLQELQSSLVLHLNGESGGESEDIH